MGYGWTFRDNDWPRLRQIIQKIGSINLGPESVPTFGGLNLDGPLTITSGSITISDLGGAFNQMLYSDTSGVINAESTLSNWIADAGTGNISVADVTGGVTLDTAQDILTSSSPTFVGLTLSGLTASSGVYTNGSSVLTSTPPTSGVLGHWDRTGTVLSPSNAGDDITTTGLGTFGSLDVDTLNLNGNVISDSTGTISFSDEDLTTTGDITCNELTLTVPTNDYNFTDRGGNQLCVQSTGVHQFELFAGSGNGTETVLLKTFAYGTPASTSTFSLMQFGYIAGADPYYGWYTAANSGAPALDLRIYTRNTAGTAYNLNQLVLGHDSSVTFGAGDVDITGGDLDITTGDLIVSTGTLTVSGLSTLGSVDVGGYLTLTTDTLISNTTLGTHHIVLVDASSNDVTITLPTGLLAGRVYQIKCIGLGATYTCDVDPNGNNLDGSASNFAMAEGESITVVMDASQDWWII